MTYVLWQIFLVVPLAGPSVAPASAPGFEASDAWCKNTVTTLAAVRADEDGARARYDVFVADLPAAFAPTVASSWSQIGEEGELEPALSVLKAAVTTMCRLLAKDNQSSESAARVQVILADPIFRGERASPDLLDQLLVRLQNWFMELFESDAMKRYAEGSRFVYLSGLVVFALVASWRLFRAGRRGRKKESRLPPVHLERKRRERASAHLQRADEALLLGDLRRAIHHAFSALLAQLGETEPGAKRVALTAREVLTRLSPSRKAIVADVFAEYERCLYQDALDHDALDHDALDHDALNHDALDHDALDHDALDGMRKAEPGSEAAASQAAKEFLAAARQCINHLVSL